MQRSSKQWVGGGVLWCIRAVAPMDDGAIIRMENAANGSSEMTLAPGESGVMNIVLEVLPVDSLRAAFVAAFLDDNSDCVKVTGVACSEILDSYCDPSWQEDDYPIEISEDLEVEYGLVWGVLI